MSTSHEERRASQSTTSDIQPSSEPPLSSADMHPCGTSPVSIINTTTPNRHRTSTVLSCENKSNNDPLCEIYLQQEQQQAVKQSTSATPTSATTNTSSTAQSINTNQTSQQDPSTLYYLRQQQHFNHHLADYPAPNKWSSSNAAANHYYTSSGVDKLIFAAMMEDAAAMSNKYVSNLTNPAHYMPLGRGIGYLNNARDSQVPTPSNKSELELYRLLERANLLNYFATFLSYGGDDVQQLADADEDEFLEIMSLVGMTQKPLHVRRLQKALIEWRENKDTENNFRRPSHLCFTQSGNINNIDSTNFHRQQHIANSGIFTDSPAPTPTSSSSQSISVMPSDNQSTMSVSDQPNGRPNHHTQAHDILVGAPKRPRLMDSLHQNHNSPSKRSTSQSPQLK